jgi:hypothetical protein
MTAGSGDLEELPAGVVDCLATTANGRQAAAVARLAGAVSVSVSEGLDGSSTVARRRQPRTGESRMRFRGAAV